MKIRRYRLHELSDNELIAELNRPSLPDQSLETSDLLREATVRILYKLNQLENK